MSLPSFGVRKPVPVNLLWMAIIVAGLIFGVTLRREFFPEVNPDQAFITLPYPGASPEEVEEGLVLKVEDKLAQLDEIDDIYTTIAEGGGGITIEFREGLNVDKAVDEVERAVDQIIDLPPESEKMQVRLFEPRLPVIRVNLYGDIDEDAMKRAILGIRDDLRDLPGMGEVLVAGTRNYELRIDVKREAMLRHGLSLPAITEAVRSWMREVPGGTVKTTTGNIKVRTMGVAERAAAIGSIVLRADPAGGSLRVSDVATVRESFIDESILTRFNGKPEVSLTVFKVGKQDIVSIAEMVRAYVDGRNNKPFVPGPIENMRIKMQGPPKPQAQQASPIRRLLAWELGRTSARSLPGGANVVASSDLARFVEGRLDLLLRNALSGGTLVFITLFLFMSWRSALWVTTGLFTAIMGTLVLMSLLDVTLNLLTMFGLIIVLGMLVDDAIVISENIETRHFKGEPALLAAVNGAEEIMWPVFGTVTTTVVAFLPLMFIKGRIGDLMGALPAVVSCALLVSVAEAVLILPCHMGHGLARRERNKDKGNRLGQAYHRFERWRDRVYFERIAPFFGAIAAFLMRWRYAAVALSIGSVLISVAMLQPFPNGRVKYDFLSSSDAETIIVDVRMPIGTPIERTDAVVARIEQVAQSLSEVKSIEALIGQKSNIDTGQSENFSPHVAQIFIELYAVEDRDRESPVIVNDLRQKLAGRLEEVERLNFSEISGGPGGPGITLRVRGEDLERIDRAAAEIKSLLAGQVGVVDIVDNNDMGQMELRVNLKPGAAALGFTQINVAQQVRGFLFGLDAHTYAADQEDIDVRVRLDEKSRRSLTEIQNIWVMNPAGKPVPLTEIAEIQDSVTYSTIKRVNRQRATTVTASTVPGISPEMVLSKIDLNALRLKYPGVKIELAGRQEQQSDAFASMPMGFAAAMLMIYVIIAWLFSSYLQPFLVMLAIPFSIVGVVFGHYLLGYELTFLSLIGFVALMGIVVNNSIVMVEFYNVERAAGATTADALVHAVKSRLRPVFLTTVTTICGLLPIILEQSFQAKFLIPMAITLAMGLASSTVMVLFILPCYMLILDDLRRLEYFLWNGRPMPTPGRATPA
jgi:multidrug efflux pump subunit AcrB